MCLMAREAKIRNCYLVVTRHVESYLILRIIASRVGHRRQFRPRTGGRLGLSSDRTRLHGKIHLHPFAPLHLEGDLANVDSLSIANLADGGVFAIDAEENVV